MRAIHADVVAVTVTYGDHFDLLARVAGPLLASPGLVRWVVVTNGVHAHVAQKIAALDARITLRSFATNTGSAPAYADGIATALETGADFVAGRILPRWETEPPSWLSSAIMRRSVI